VHFHDPHTRASGARNKPQNPSPPLHKISNENDVVEDYRHELLRPIDCIKRRFSMYFSGGIGG
jgi:hypothetical protein